MNDEEARARYRYLQLKKKAAMAQQSSAMQPQGKPINAGLQGVADTIEGGMSAVMGPIVRGVSSGAQALSEKAFGTPAVTNLVGKGNQMVGQGIKGAEEYVSGKLGEIGVNPYVAGAVPIAGEIAASMLMPTPKIPGGKLASTLANKADKSASSRWFKGLGGTLPQAKELGAEETLRLGRVAREKGIITPLNSAESQAKNISEGLTKSGKRIEELRALGDLYGNSPEAKQIIQAIRQDIGDKYKTGIRSGQSGELEKAIEEVLKLEPVDRLTPGEEFAGFMKRDIPGENVPVKATTPPIGEPLIDEPNTLYPMMGGKTKKVPNPDYVPPTDRTVDIQQGPYDKFRMAQDSPDYVPEYDLRRDTTFNEVAKVATDLNAYAKGQSKLLQPSGATTDVANVVTRENNKALMKVLPKEKGAEYQAKLQDYADLSKLDRMNELKLAWEVGGSRNSLVNNLANRIYHAFGHQLSAEALDRIAGILRSRIPDSTKKATAGVAGRAVMEEYIRRRNKGNANGK